MEVFQRLVSKPHHVQELPVVPASAQALHLQAITETTCLVLMEVGIDSTLRSSLLLMEVSIHSTRGAAMWLSD
jgi:hypothetical protein